MLIGLVVKHVSAGKRAAAGWNGLSDGFSIRYLSDVLSRTANAVRPIPAVSKSADG